MTKKRLYRVLSLDGGGIRGLLSAHLLAALEQKINDKWAAQHGSPPDRPLRLAQFFDIVAGTSTGGILACALLCPDEQDPNYARYSARETISLYRDYGRRIFSKTLSGRTGVAAVRWARYSGGPLEQILTEKFGDTRLSQLLRPCLITSYDIEKRRAIFFTSHDAKEKGELYDYYLRDVARSTSAAPTYFPPHHVVSLGGLETSGIDGGLFANNPTMCAVVEALKIFGKETEGGRRRLLEMDELFVLSIGTGNIKKPYFFQKAQSWGLLPWVAPIIDIMMTGVAETVDYQLRKLYSAVQRPDQYVRLMPSLGTASDDMDDVSPRNLQALNQAGIQNAYDADSTLDKVADMLLAGFSP